MQDHLSGLGLLGKLLPLLERLRVIFPVLFLLILFLLEKVLLPTKSCNPALTVVIYVCVLLNKIIVSTPPPSSPSLSKRVPSIRSMRKRDFIANVEQDTQTNLSAGAGKLSSGAPS